LLPPFPAFNLRASLIKGLQEGIVMRSSNKVLSMFLVFALAAMPAGAAPVATPLGVVVVASQAKVGGGQAVNGSTVFQGDRLLTAENGQLQVRFGGAQARFLPGSSAVVNRTPAGISADLLSGSVILAHAAGDTFSLTANEALLRPAASQAVIAQVTRVSPTELLLSAREGALEVTYDGEVQTIQAGSTYRMLLDPAAAEPQGPAPRGTLAAGKSKGRAIFILVGVAAAATGIAIAAASSGSSSSSPVSPAVP
jgi:hypothetical protein